MLTGLAPGPVNIRTEDGKEEVYFVSGGYLEVQPHHISILADTAQRAHDMDEAAAKQARTKPSAKWPTAAAKWTTRGQPRDWRKQRLSCAPWKSSAGRSVNSWVRPNSCRLFIETALPDDAC